MQLDDTILAKIEGLGPVQMDLVTTDLAYTELSYMDLFVTY